MLGFGGIGWRWSSNYQEMLLSGEYPAVVNGANGRVLEVPGSFVSGSLDGNRGSPVLAIEHSLAEFLWINLSIICVRADIWAWEGSKFGLIFSSITSGENPVLVSSHRSIRMRRIFVLDEQTFLDAFASRRYYHSSVLCIREKSS